MSKTNLKIEYILKASNNQLGYKNYTAFKDEVIFERIVRLKQIRDRYESFEKNKIIQIMSQLRHHLINMDEIDKICKQINEHERFIAYGSPTLLNYLIKRFC